MLMIYGIKNCDTMKKAFKWLDEQQIPYQFHNYKSDGLTDSLLQSLIDQFGWQSLLNTRGTTWRKLDEAVRNATNNEASAKAIMLANPSIIKRPALVSNDGTLLGFNADEYQQFFTNHQ